MNPAAQNQRTNAHWLERWVHFSLLGGILLSSGLLVVGLVLVFVRHEERPQGLPMTLAAVIPGVRSGNGVACLDLGLLVLMLTPALRVCVLAIGWTLANAYRFALVAITVLTLLGASLFCGFG